MRRTRSDQQQSHPPKSYGSRAAVDAWSGDWPRGRRTFALADLARGAVTRRWRGPG